MPEIGQYIAIPMPSNVGKAQAGQQWCMPICETSFTFYIILKDLINHMTGRG